MSITIKFSLGDNKEELHQVLNFCTSAGINISNLSEVDFALLPEEEQHQRHMAARAELLSKIRGGLFVGCFEDDEDEAIPTIKQLNWVQQNTNEYTAYGALTPTNDCVLDYSVRTSKEGRIDAFFVDTGELVYSGYSTKDAEQAWQAHFEEVVKQCLL
jgi:hypothetical protein